MFTLRTEPGPLADTQADNQAATLAPILTIVQGDLARADTDAVVNAANAQLAGGGGVDGAIHRAAGHAKLQTACRDIITRRGKPLEPGEAVITPGFGLPARFIIHTVGPIWRGGSQGEPQALARAYAGCLRLAAEHSVASLAFPAISCGAYGYPVHLAAPLALETLLRELAQGPARGVVNEIRMVLHGRAALDQWLEAARKIQSTQ